MQNWSNAHKIKFKSTYEGYPIIKPSPYKTIKTWIGINEVLSYEGDKRSTGVYFFKDDYQFERVYNAPKKWCNILQQYNDPQFLEGRQPSWKKISIATSIKTKPNKGFVKENVTSCLLKIQRHILSTCCSDLSFPWRFLCTQCFPSCTNWRWCSWMLSSLSW